MARLSHSEACSILSDRWSRASRDRQLLQLRTRPSYCCHAGPIRLGKRLWIKSSTYHKPKFFTGMDALVMWPHLVPSSRYGFSKCYCEVATGIHCIQAWHESTVAWLVQQSKSIGQESEVSRDERCLVTQSVHQDTESHGRAAENIWQYQDKN